MRIAQVAPPFESVPPAGYGGTERVVATLCNELVRRGHEVTLFAAGESCTSATLVPTVDQALWHCEPPLKDFGPSWAMTLDTVLERAAEFDVIHSHLDYWGYILARFARVPVVTTLHGRLDLPELQPLYRRLKDLPLVSISDAQRRPVWWANFVATVYHGIDLEEFTFSPHSDGYLAYLGRISPEKGLDAAIRIALQSGMPLKIAARLPLRHMQDPNVQVDRDYYENVIKPLLKHDQIEFVGELAGKDKDVFLGGAEALLFPICWPEPFGLVMAEALACGTPVLALDHGSVPEIVEDGLTGFVRNDEQELVQAVARIRELRRSACRAEAERRFSQICDGRRLRTLGVEFAGAEVILLPNEARALQRIRQPYPSDLYVPGHGIRCGRRSLNVGHRVFAGQTRDYGEAGTQGDIADAQSDGSI